MKMLRELQLTGIENLLSELEEGGSYVLPVSHDPKYLAIGGEASFVQACITWAQHESRPTMRFAPKATAQTADLVSRFSTLSAVLLTDVVKQGEINLSEVIQKSAIQRLKILQSLDPSFGSRGPQIEIVAADHLGYSYPSTLYQQSVDGRRVVKPASSLREIANRILKVTMATEYRQERASILIEPLAGAIYELFRNTDDHARTDLQGNFLRRSIRAIQARRHAMTPKALERVAADTPALADYVRRLDLSHNRRQHHLLEVSILDSGPGIAARQLGRLVGRTDEKYLERNAIYESFAKSVSTKPRPGAGMGLPNVIAIMRKANGFLRLRTGSQSLYADLSLEQSAAYGDIPDLLPLHNRPVIAPANGTLFSLLIPVGEIA